MKRKLLTVLMCAMIAVTAFAQSGTMGDLTWEVKDGTLTISGQGAMPDYSIPKPSPWRLAYKDSIKSVTIEEGVTTIGEYAFSFCSVLSSVTIPNSVTEIGKSAFYQCAALTSVTFPSSVTKIADGIFSTCGSLTSISVDIENKYYTSEDGVLFDKKKEKLIWYPRGKTETKYTVPNSVKEIGAGLFSGCNLLTSITLPNSITEIGQNAFYQCTALSSITLPNSLTTIENNTFYYCRSLSSISLPTSITSIGEYAFYGCSSLTFITLPNSLTTIGERAFSSSGLTSIVFPSSVTTIGESAFSYTNTLKQVEASWTTPLEIASNTFYETSLRERVLYVPVGTKSLYESAMGWEDFNTIVEGTMSNASGTTGDLTWVLKDGLLTISGEGSMPDYEYNGQPWYGYLDLIKSVTIGDGITKVGKNAFYYCTSLTSILVDSENKYYTSDNGVLFDKKKEKLVWYPADKGETEYVVPNSVVTIENDAFSRCISLISVTLPNSVKEIAERAFYECFSLSSISLPSSIEEIGADAFSYCSSLKQVQVSWHTPLNAFLFTFSGVSLEECTLYVPVGTKSLYKAADIWKDFGTIVEGSITGIETPKVESKIYISGNTLHVDTSVAESILVYSAIGELLYNFAKLAGESSFELNKEQQGVVIVKTSSGVSKKLISGRSL